MQNFFRSPDEQKSSNVLPSLCNNPDLRKPLVAKHLVPVSTLSNMIAGFFGTAPQPAFKSMSVADMNQFINGANCETDTIDFIADYGDKTSNNEIAIIVTGPQGTPQYSIPFFKAIMENIACDEFQFSKAMSATGNCVIFKAISNGVETSFDVVGNLP